MRRDNSKKNYPELEKIKKAINLPLLHILHKGYKHFESVSVYHCVYLSVLRVLMVIFVIMSVYHHIFQSVRHF